MLLLGELVAVILAAVVVMILVAVIKKGKANMLFKQQLLLGNTLPCNNFRWEVSFSQRGRRDQNAGECRVWTQQATWKHGSDIKC